MALPDMAHCGGFERGGFWRRALALSIDAVVVAVVLELLAFALFPLSNGRLQSTGGLTLLYCDTLAAVPEGLSIPADLATEPVRDCRSGLFGLTSARVIKVSKVTRNGAIATTKEFNILVDADGRQVSGPNLDLALLPLLFVLRWLFDCVGGTPGRRMCRVRLRDAADGHSPLPMQTVARRYAAQAFALAPVLVWSSIQPLLSGALPPESPWSSLGLASSAALTVVAVAIALNAMIYRRDAWYDRFAATSVLRVDQHEASIRLAAVAPPSRSAAADLATSLAPSQQAVAAALGLDGARASLPPPLPKPAATNYFARHWRGELSLPQSYWLNGLLGGFAVGLAIGALGYAIGRQGDAQPVLWLASLILIWGTVALVTAWQLVGVWRSATHYQQSGRKFWGAAAKLVTVLGGLNAGYNFLFFGAAQMMGMYEIISGDSRVGPHQFQVSADGQMLDFSGGITFGVAKELDGFLSAMGNLKTVRLSSNGGRILEAQKMSDLLRARGLSTLVTQSCLSACTIVFLGGKERFISPSGRLGFHQPAFRGMTAADRRAAIATEEERLQRLGLSRAFAERANTATPNDMWYPDSEELLREKVVTRWITPPTPTNPPATNARPVATVTITRPPPTPPASGAPLALPAPGAPLQTESGTNQTGRVVIPADLMKRLSTPPKKPAVVPPPAGAGTAGATGERK
jgi:RDD family